MRFNSIIILCETLCKSYILMYTFENSGVLLHHTIDVPLEKYFYCWSANTQWLVKHVLSCYINSRTVEEEMRHVFSFTTDAMFIMYNIFTICYSYEGPAKSSVTNRLT